MAAAFNQSTGAERTAKNLLHDPLRPQLQVIPANVEAAISCAPLVGIVLGPALGGRWATVDGVPVPIYSANHVVRAVPVEIGHHVVAFRYEPLSVRAGAWLSGVALLAILGLAVIDRPRSSDVAEVLPSAVA